MPRGRGRCGFKRRWGHGMRVVEPMMLLLLAEEPAHGYHLAERLIEVFDIASLPAQTVYRALQAMEEQGWITSEWDMEGAQGPPRKVFQITEAGIAVLDAWSAEIEALRETLNTFAENYQRFRESQ
jgi:PadR family transcriptional regulator PadR